jgi:hypothetical protein
MKNIYAEQVNFFQEPEEAVYDLLDRSKGRQVSALSLFVEDMSSIDMTNIPYFTKTEKGYRLEEVVINFDGSIPEGLVMSYEGFRRVVKEFHLKSGTHTLYYKPAKKLLWLLGREYKVGKFLTLLNPAISDKHRNTCVTEWFDETGINSTDYRLVELTASDVYKPGVGPVSCMTGTDVSFWDILGSKAITLFRNDRIIGRTLLHKGKFYDNLYTFSYTDKARFINLLTISGYSSVYDNAGLTIEVPEGMNATIPYLDSFVLKGNTLVLKDK